MPGLTSGSIALSALRAGGESVDNPELAAASRVHLAETDEHERLIKARLEAYGAKPSILKDVTQQGLAVVAGAFVNAAPDTGAQDGDPGLRI